MEEAHIYQAQMAKTQAIEAKKIKTINRSQ